MDLSILEIFTQPQVIVSYCALVVSLCTVILVGIQLKWLIKQLRLDALLRILAANREILSLGFSHSELFDVMRGSPVTLESQKRYLQLWLNHMDTIWNAQRFGLFEKTDAAANRQDILDFFALDSMQVHWREVRKYYSPNFQGYIDSIVADVELAKVSGTTVGYPPPPPPPPPPPLIVLGQDN